MEKPLFGKISFDPKIKDAVEKALEGPCAFCGSREDLVARQLVPRKPAAFCVPGGVALYVPLCPVCKHRDAVDLEAHLLACRVITASENLGLSLDDL